MIRKTAIILILTLIAAVLWGCAEAESDSGTIFDMDDTAQVLRNADQPKAVSVFAIAATPSPAPTVCPVKSPVPAPSMLPAPSPDAALEEIEPKDTPEPALKEDRPGYTMKDIKDEKGYVYAKTVNLRSGPGRDYDVIREFDRNDRLTVTGRCGGWYEVEIGEHTGFMLKEFVKLGDVPRATPKPTPKSTKKPKPTRQPSEKPRHEHDTDKDSSSYTEDELYLIAQVVYKEGDGESYAAVASVIQNRINSGSFPNSVKGVIYQSGQFSVSGLKSPSSSAKRAVAEVFVNGNNCLPSDVLYFRTAPNWEDRELYIQIGDNYFYK